MKMEASQIIISGYEVLISQPDLEIVLSKKWRICAKGNPYPYFVHSYKQNKKVKHIYLHRLITNCPAGKCVDHINGNTLDNQRENLRVCTTAQNIRNQKKNITNTSGYKGVSWNNRHGKWFAFICINRKNKNLGSFATAEQAYKAYCEASTKYHGEFGRLE
jgi:hypothetical protein